VVQDVEREEVVLVSQNEEVEVVEENNPESIVKYLGKHYK
jgi:hypothetical protein